MHMKPRTTCSDSSFLLQVKCYGPGLEPTGCIVNKPAEFTIDARGAGRGQLRIYAQVPFIIINFIFIITSLSTGSHNKDEGGSSTGPYTKDGG